MIKEALQYIIGLQKEPYIKDINGSTYTDTDLKRINHNPKAATLGMSTLTSLVDYIRGNIDTMAPKMIIEASSPTRVELYSQLDSDRTREYLVEVNANIPVFNFGEFQDKENFIIGMQAKFLDDIQTDKALVLRFAGTVESKSVAQYGDDGVTQKASIKTGIASKSNAVVPNPVALRPYRTFIEVEQPKSDFIFRMKEGKYDDGVQCALFEADGGAWKNVAVRNIKEYLENELSEYREQFLIIS